MQADAFADARADADTHSCADVETDALADALVRAWLHAPHHARCAAHGHACTGMHDDAHTCARERTGTQSWALTHQCDRAVHICAATVLGLRQYCSTSLRGLRSI